MTQSVRVGSIGGGADTKLDVKVSVNFNTALGASASINYYYIIAIKLMVAYTTGHITHEFSMGVP